MSELEPYPDELPRIKDAFEKLSALFANTAYSDAAQDQFDAAARDLFGKAGFTVEVEWYGTKIGGLETPTVVPRVSITGRTRKEDETDHSRVQWGVVNGLVDGQKGYIREDGSRTEEPIKKTIY